MANLSTRVFLRDDFGRFATACDAAATRTVQDAIKEGERLAIALAPKGKKADHRTESLANSIGSRMTSATSGEWYSTARHAMAIEFGAGPHQIVGNPYLVFFWEKLGTTAVLPYVNHPGNRSQPFMRPAFNIIMKRRVLRIAKKHYPG